jgi:hypothetical protein
MENMAWNSAPLAARAFLCCFRAYIVQRVLTDIGHSLSST